MRNKLAAFAIKAIVMALLFCGVIALCTSCRTTSGCEISYDRAVDTVYINHTIRDSIQIHDSIYESIYVQDDTIVKYKYKQKIQYRDKLVHDTIYKAHNDTVFVYKEKVVTQKIGLLTRLKDAVGSIVLLFFIGFICFFIFKRLRG